MWEKSSSAPLVNAPPSLQAALNLLNRNPNIQIWAGGTALPSKPADQILSLNLVDEIKKITPWERFVDWGAGLSLNQLVLQGKNLLPPLLLSALKTLGNYPLRNQGTLGGNLCSEPGGDLFPLLQALGAQAEFRSAKGFRWEASSQWPARGLKPLPGEILCRIRIPKETWNLTLFEKLGTHRSAGEEQVSYFVLARITRETISALRMGIYFPSAGLLRNRALEANLQGRKLPFTPQDKELIYKAWEEEFPFLTKPLAPFQSSRLTSITDWMIKQIREE